VPSCIYRINNLQGDLIMLGLIKKLFGAKPAEATQPEAAPYKVETPVAAPEPAPTPVAEKATEAVVQSIAKPAKKAPVKKAAPKKEAAPKKSGRKPKAK
jgi:hypothetical protein